MTVADTIANIVGLTQVGGGDGEPIQVTYTRAVKANEMFGYSFQVSGTPDGPALQHANVTEIENLQPTAEDVKCTSGVTKGQKFGTFSIVSGSDRDIQYMPLKEDRSAVAYKGHYGSYQYNFGKESISAIHCSGENLHVGDIITNRHYDFVYGMDPDNTPYVMDNSISNNSNIETMEVFSISGNVAYVKRNTTQLLERLRFGFQRINLQNARTAYNVGDELQIGDEKFKVRVVGQHYIHVERGTGDEYRARNNINTSGTWFNIYSKGELTNVLHKKLKIIPEISNDVVKISGVSHVMYAIDVDENEELVGNDGSKYFALTLRTQESHFKFPRQ